MPAVVLGRPPMVPVGVAVPASVWAGVVGADVARLEAVAPGAHAPVPEPTKLHAVGAPQDVERHAAARMDAVSREVPVGAAGLKPEAVLGGDAPEHPRELVHVLHRKRHELGYVEAQTLHDDDPLAANTLDYQNRVRLQPNESAGYDAAAGVVRVLLPAVSWTVLHIS